MPHGRELVRFTDAMVAADALGGGDTEELSRAREALVAAIGVTAMVDAAAVASNFQRMVRIADGTGIALDDGADAFTAGVRTELAIDRFRR